MSGQLQLARCSRQFTEKANHTDNAPRGVCLHNIESRKYKLAVFVVYSPVITMKSVLRVYFANSRVDVTRVFGMHFVNIGFKPINTSHINRRVNKANLWR